MSEKGGFPIVGSRLDDTARVDVQNVTPSSQTDSHIQHSNALGLPY